MNIYKILFSHYGKKDSIQGIVALVLAENDGQVYDWIASNPKTEEMSIYNSWRDRENYSLNEETGTFFDENGYELRGWKDEDGNPETFKQRMLRLGGEIYDEDVDLSDSYYGITLYGWELLKENVTTDYFELIELGIVVVI